MSKDKVQPKKEKAYNAQDFAKEYEALCQKGFQIVANPALVATNHGSYEIVVRLQVGQTPKQE